MQTVSAPPVPHTSDDGSAPGRSRDAPPVPLSGGLGSFSEQPQHSKSFWAVEPPLPVTEPARGEERARNSRFVPLCFDNAEAAFRGVPSADLARSVAVFSTCGIQPLVRNADWLFRYSQRLLGRTVTGMAVRHTFYKHFCAGEDQEVLLPCPWPTLALPRAPATPLFLH